MFQGRRQRTLIDAVSSLQKQGSGYRSPVFAWSAAKMNTMRMHTNGWLVALLALIFSVLSVLTSGCSTIRVVYNQADTVLAWMADDYFDFDGAQKQDFHTRIDRLLKWHRQEQLPDYARLLTEIKQRSQRPVTRDDATWLIENSKARYRVITQQGAGDAADMLATLTPDNLRALEKQFAKVNQKFAREHKLNGTQEARRKERLDRTLKRIREWTAALTPAQEERIAALNDTIPDTDHLRQQERQRRQKEFLALLNTRHNKAEFTRALAPWLADWEKGQPSEVHQALNDSYEKRIALYLEVERMLTPQQRAHVQYKIQSYIDDLQALTAKRVTSN
jgi:hypothetical protein